MKLHLARLLLAVLLCSTSASALEGWLVDGQGLPVVSARVSVQGMSGWFTSDRAGRFELPWDPTPPFVLVIVGADEQSFVPVAVSVIPEESWKIEVQRAFVDEITVAAETAPHVTSSPAASSTLLTNEETKRTAPQTLADSIRDIPGATVVGEGPAAVPVIRGMAKSRTLLLIDDARVMTERRAGPSATFIDPFDLEAVEVTRGPGSVAYGSDAMGGVIHLRTHLPTDVESPRARVRLTTEVGAQTMESVSAEALWPALGGSMLFRARYRDFANYENSDGAEVLDSSFQDSGAAIRWGGDTRLGRLQLGLAIDEGRNIGRPSTASDEHRTRYPVETSRRMTLSLQRPTSATEFHATLGIYRLVLDRETPREGLPQALERSDVESTDVTLRGQTSRILGAGYLVTGVDFNARLGLTATTVDETRPSIGGRNQIVNRPIDDADRTDLGTFATWDVPLSEGVLLSTGLRADWVRSVNRADGGGKAASQIAPSGHLAITTGPWRGLTTTLQLSSGFREPSLSDRYFTGPTARGFVHGNPDLDPERSYQLDLSTRWNVGRRSVVVSAYDYRIDDLIERFRDGEDFRFRNRGEAEIRGLEIEATTPLREGQLRIGATLARGEAEDGSYLDDVPGAAVNLAMDRPIGRITAGLRLSHVFDDDQPGPTEARRGAYTVLDASLTVPIRKGLELRLTPRNIFDRRYHRAAEDSAPPAPGRSVAIQLSASWE